MFNLYESTILAKRRNFPWFFLFEFFFQDMKLKVETSVAILSKKECHCHIENLKMTLVVRTRHFVCRCNYILDTYFIFLQVILFEIDEKYFQYKPKCVGWMLWIDCWCSIWNCFYRFDYLQNVYIKWQTNCHILVYLKKLCFKFIKNSLTSLSTYHTYI